jgi:hypothetical protein
MKVKVDVRWNAVHVVMDGVIHNQIRFPNDSDVQVTMPPSLLIHSNPVRVTTTNELLTLYYQVLQDDGSIEDLRQIGGFHSVTELNRVLNKVRTAYKAQTKDDLPELRKETVTFVFDTSDMYSAINKFSAKVKE